MAELVRRELSSLIVRDFADYGIGIVSITSVDMTRDLRKAKVYVTAFDDGQDEEEIVGILKDNVSVMRKALASRLELRRVPELDFYYDSSVQRGARLSKMIDGLVPSGDAVDEH